MPPYVIYFDTSEPALRFYVINIDDDLSVRWGLDPMAAMMFESKYLAEGVSHLINTFTPEIPPTGVTDKWLGDTNEFTE
jgi:hypothetical protein